MTETAFRYITAQAKLRRNALPVEIVSVVTESEPDEGVCCEECWSETTWTTITYKIANFGLPFTERFRGDAEDLADEVESLSDLAARYGWW